MLILSLKPDDRIMITDENDCLIATLTLVRCQGGRAYIGFDADPHIQIDRESVYDDKRAYGKHKENP